MILDIKIMWFIQKIIYRLWHYALWAVTRILPFPNPELIKGAGSIAKLAAKIKTKNSKVLIVTDKSLMSLGLLNGLFDSLTAQKIEYIVFDEVQPNPSIENVEAGVVVYKQHQCDGIIAFGGGSPIDCAKIIGARITNSFLSIRHMAGLFRVRFKLPPLYCVPTTAGTGTETTIVSVISDKQAHKKLIITDISLTPIIAVLDPELMIGLPPHITAATGVDALTHSIEAYIGIIGTQYTNQCAEDATRLIFQNLEKAYNNGKNITARDNMAMASFYAGSAFTRAYVGYVHAIAHNMGALYNVPHGLANAIILPHILEFCRDAVEPKLARLCVIAELGDASESDTVLCDKFIEGIKQLNERMNIATVIPEIKEADIPEIIDRVMKESHPGYPIPKFMDRKQCEVILRNLMP
ncbi:MAG: alcohol dehydrogenase [Oleispira sp.]|jgi:alcohol dehydrogenase